MQRILDIYFHDIFTGKLIQNKENNLCFQYNDAYIKRGAAPAISLSMPVQPALYEDNRVKSYFSGLLPEAISRHRLAKYLGISEKNSFALLEAIGGECAGALSLYPEGKKPAPPSEDDLEKLDNQKLREILDLLKRRPLLAGTDNLRLSLAGAQDKIAVGKVDGQLTLITGTTPTSHILKPVIENVKDSVHNEIFCMHLAQIMGIDAPETEIYWLEETPYFLIERYDRVKNDDRITRLHQEDFCQAMGIMPEFKYQREGGPGVAQCIELLQKYSLQPAADHHAFLQRLIFNYLIGNADAHSKNVSLLYKANLPVLAPAYDLLCTAVYPEVSLKMAMKIGRKYNPDHVCLRHWHEMVANTKTARKSLERDLKKISQLCLHKALELKSNLRLVGIYSSIFEDICNIIKKRSEHIQFEMQ